MSNCPNSGNQDVGGDTSSVLKYQTNNIHSGHIDMPSMVNKRRDPACTIFRSPAHNGRPIAIAAGGHGEGCNTQTSKMRTNCTRF